MSLRVMQIEPKQKMVFKIAWTPSSYIMLSVYIRRLEDENELLAMKIAGCVGSVKPAM